MANMTGTMFPGTIVRTPLERRRFRLLGYALNSGQPLREGAHLYQIRCANPSCGALNRVPPYSINQVPRCPECDWVLPEPVLTRLLRAARRANHAILWMALGLPEHPPPSTRLMSCAHIANRRLSRIIGARTMYGRSGSNTSKGLPSASTIAGRLDWLNVMDAAAIPMRAEPAATRCGEMVE